MPAPQVEEMFPWEISQAVAERPIGYLPLGTLEWHGEHSAVGLDGLKAHAVCIQAARISGGIVLPPFYFAADEREDLPDGEYLTGGVEHGERYHVPGNMFWLREETYKNLLLDVYEAMRRRGIRAIVVLCGHWSHGTLPVVRASGEEFAARQSLAARQSTAERDHETGWLMLADRDVVAKEPPGSPLFYPHEHAAGGEISLLMHLRPDLVDLEKTFATLGPLAQHYTGEPAHLRRRAETGYKYIGVLRGVEDDSNDPELSASAARGKVLLDAIAARVAARASALLEDIWKKEMG